MAKKKLTQKEVVLKITEEELNILIETLEDSIENSFNLATDSIAEKQEKLLSKISNQWDYVKK